MSTIGKFLEAKEPLLDHALAQLEDETGKKGVDVRLAADIAETAANRIKRLGLAPNCSGPELYHALIKQVAVHDEHLAHKIGGKDPSDLKEMVPLIVKTAEEPRSPRVVGS